MCCVSEATILQNRVSDKPILQNKVLEKSILQSKVLEKPISCIRFAILTAIYLLVT